MSKLQRLAVFIDHQNVYKGAREARGAKDGDDHTIGQIDPLNLGKLITSAHPSYPGAQLRKLEMVRVYRGVPSNKQDPRGYGATRKQVARWLKDQPMVDVSTRTLDYRTGNPREKGIDVALALDLAFGAAAKMFDVVVLFSGDADLLPALERAHGSKVVCETASWQGGARRLKRAPCTKWEHVLDKAAYDSVHDPFDYT